MDVLGKDVSIARILDEGENFITMEVAKSDAVTFTLNQDSEGNVVGGDKFLTLLFVHVVDGKMRIWKPWEND